MWKAVSMIAVCAGVCMASPAATGPLAQSASVQTAQSTAPASPLTNKDVLEMWKGGKSAKAIVAKIKASACDFDKSAKALDELRAADAPYAVIAAMMHAAGPDAEPEKETPAAQPAPPATPPPAASPRPSTPAPAITATPSPNISGEVEVTIPDSMPFVVVLEEDLSSEQIKTNYVVYFSVAEDVKVNGLTIIAKGARARARVIDAKKSRSWGRGARIFMTMQDVIAVDGGELPVRGGNDIRGNDSNQSTKNAAIVTMQVAPIVAPVYGLKKGGKVGIPAGTRFEVYVYGTRRMKVKTAPAPAASVSKVPESS